ncbi:MAG: flagellar protein FlaG [Thiomicrospira sp.]|uniref:flagellar protein FlaG n=1 Tax=Thiomicrospira sp. TaxID=935 RepID=UPI001A054F24|nr:flagellar protein FlaG [Thiomicrospira sp.]MBE0494470.1 flagellar protein FlaG [Thiomicrospira sp.]
MSELTRLATTVSNQVYVNATKNSFTSFNNDGNGRYPTQLTDVLKTASPKQNDGRSESAVAPVETKQATPEALDQAVRVANTQLEASKTNYLRFERDELTDKMVIAIKNAQTDELIMQIPSEDFLRIAKNIDAYLKQVNNGFSDSPNSMPVGLFTNQQV